jgi:TPR repeat protein
MYYQGKGVNQDKNEAAKWYRLAAEQGDPDAQFILGVMYYQGDRVGKDVREAFKWFRLAAEQGSPEAQSTLKSMYDSLVKTTS